VRAGRIDGDAAEAVLGAAGHRAAKRREWPAGLTTREVDILRLLARGLSNKQIAASLFISSKTANTHVEHIYSKLGVTNRALASLFAAKHGPFRLTTASPHKSAHSRSRSRPRTPRPVGHQREHPTGAAGSADQLQSRHDPRRRPCSSGHSPKLAVSARGGR
jgi:DNA-binding CsgD family transcriptional regulator